MNDCISHGGSDTNCTLTHTLPSTLVYHTSDFVNWCQHNAIPTETQMNTTMIWDHFYRSQGWGSFLEAKQYSSVYILRKSSARSRNFGQRTNLSNCAFLHCIKIYWTLPVTDRNYDVLSADPRVFYLCFSQPFSVRTCAIRRTNAESIRDLLGSEVASLRAPLICWPSYHIIL